MANIPSYQSLLYGSRRIFLTGSDGESGVNIQPPTSFLTRKQAQTIRRNNFIKSELLDKLRKLNFGGTPEQEKRKKKNRKAIAFNRQVLNNESEIDFESDDGGEQEENNEEVDTRPSTANPERVLVSDNQSML